MSETKALAAQIQSLLDQYRAIEEKTRHVRNTQYWGAPYGTPLPLARRDSAVSIPQGWPKNLTDPPEGYIDSLGGEGEDREWERTPAQTRAATINVIRFWWEHRTPDEIEQAVAKVREMRKGDVAIAIDPGPLFYILTEGEPFKSQFETGTSNGLLNHADRSRVELALLDVPLDHAPDARPIYGYMVTDDASPIQKSVRHYGAVRVVLNKDVRARTTMTIGDSLDEGMVPVPLTGEVGEDRLFAANPNVVTEVGSVIYAEAQIHGGVDADDIAEIWLPTVGIHNIESLVKAAEIRGIPIRWYGTVKDERGGGIILFHEQEVEAPAEFKTIRRVRDPLYWGKPYGTPITPGMTPMHGVVQIPIPGVPEIPDVIPTRSKRGTWTKYDSKESSLIGDGPLPGVGEVYVNSHGDTVVFEQGVPGDEKSHQQALADIDWMYDHLPEEMTKTTVDVVFPANDYQFSDATTETDRYRLRDSITFGYVVGNSHVIHINPTLLKDEGIMWPIVRDTWRENTVPALQNMPIRRAVLMHESGHVVESMMTPLTGPLAPEGKEREKGQRLYLRWLDAHSDYGRGNMIEAYAEMYAEWMLGDPSDHDTYAAATEYAELYGWGTPMAGVKALLSDLDRTMIELKRKVRDAEYWGFPVGTPFPLPTRGEFRISDVSPGHGLPNLTRDGLWEGAEVPYSVSMRDEKVDPRLWERAKEIFEFHEEINGHQWDVEVTSGLVDTNIYPRSITAAVGGKIYRDGKEVGKFRREMLVARFDDGLQHKPWALDDRVGRWVHNDLLRIDPKVCGQGFGERYAEYVEQNLAEEGYETEWLEANIDVGGYAWARRGYDWFPEYMQREGFRTPVSYTIRLTIDEMESELLRQQPEEGQTITSENPLRYPGPFDQALVDHLKEIADNIGLEPTFTPQEVASLGEGDPRYAWTGNTTTSFGTEVSNEGERVRAEVPMWPGKWFMLHTRWWGVKKIEAPAQQKAEGTAEYLTRLRATVPEFEQTYQSAYYRNPEESDYNLFGADLHLGPASTPETKVRHVRDPEYWGAPEGTPLPLPRAEFQRVVGVFLEQHRGISPEYFKDTANVTTGDYPHAYGEDKTAQVKAVVAHDVTARMGEFDVNAVTAALGLNRYGHQENWLTYGDLQTIMTGEGELVTEPAATLGYGPDPDLRDEYTNDEIRVLLDKDGQIEVIAPTKGENIDHGDGEKPRPYKDRLGRKPAKLGSPEAQQYVREAIVTMLIHQWANTSNDSDPVSLAIQEAAKEEFGLEDTAIWEEDDGFVPYSEHMTPEEMDEQAEAEEQARIERLGLAPFLEPEPMALYRRFLRAQYENTQDMLEQMRVPDTVEVMRGYTTHQLPPLTDGPMPLDPKTAVIQTRPLSSWSSSQLQAEGFGVNGERGQSVLLRAEVPRSRILATPATGIGCLSEDEVVLLGGTDTATKIEFGTPDGEWADSWLREGEEGWLESTAAYDMQMGEKTARIRHKKITPLVVDNNLTNADWPKRTWDLPLDPQYYRKRFGDRLGSWYKRIKDLPVGRGMPDTLRTAIIEMITSDGVAKAVKAHESELRALLDGFLAIERKARHVRDADYWGAPVGTPLPLKPKPEPATRTVRLIPDTPYDPKALKPGNLDPTVETVKYTDSDGKVWQDWADLDPGEPQVNEPGLEFAASMAWQRTDPEDQGRVFTDPDEVDAFVTEVLERAGYHDRVVSINIGDDFLGPDIEAGVTRGQTQILPPDHQLYNSDAPVLLYRSKGVSEYVLLHEIAHIIDGEWKPLRPGGHSFRWWNTFGALLAQHGDMEAPRNMLQFFGAVFEDAGVLQ